MFRPPSIFFANGKARLLRHALVAVGHPIDEVTARLTVARAWGWASWSELSAEMERRAPPSPLDEDLVGAGAGAMVDSNRLVVATRRGSASGAIRLVIGLPHQICITLSAFLRLTGRHTQEGVWMSPEAYRLLYADCMAPKPLFVQELLEGIRDLKERPAPFPLPPHRPR